MVTDGNFPQSRVTDHRIGLTSPKLTGVMAGDFSEFTAALQKDEMAERMAEA
jgi:peptide chain release factor 1